MKAGYSFITGHPKVKCKTVHDTTLLKERLRNFDFTNLKIRDTP